MDHCTLAIICVSAALLCLGSTASAQEPGFKGFEFSIPFEGVAEGTAPADLARVTRRGEGAGFVAVRDGRFVLSDADEPIRFWATNLCFGGCFPPHDVAERMARRMASLGINCVRFHHMDSSGYPRGIWRNQGSGDFEHTDLHPEALDRLDYLIAQMKQNGIYANLNLHVSRTYGEKDGFPAVGRGESVPNYGKGVDTFYPKCIEEQKRYARMLLRHVNRYTGNAYAEEPAVAMVEISNEDGLLREWKGGGLDRLPEPYVRELERQWNEWLSRTYGSTEALREAWSQGEAPGGREDLLAAPGVVGHLQVVENARASVEQTTGSGGQPIYIIAVQEASPTSWHVQYMWSPVAVRAGTTYLLRLKLRANREASASVDCRMSSEPWTPLGLRQDVSLTPDWREHELYFVASQDEPRARITLSGLSQEDLRVSVTEVSLRVAAVCGLRPEEELGAAGVSWPSRRELDGRTDAFRLDVVRFLRDTEVAYWKGMCEYLHRELGVKMPVTGTAVGYTTPDIAAETVDFVDSHAYWRHPQFPGRPWDPENWLIRPDVMVGTPERSTVPTLAARRVFGLPYTVTEYNHPSPHRYEAEGFPLIALWGSYQAWDGVFTFTYASGERWEIDHFPNFFSIAGNPVKMAVQPACSHMVVGGAIRPSSRALPTRTTPEQRLHDILSSQAWSLGGYPEGLDPLAWQEALLGHALTDAPVSAGSGAGSDLGWEVGDDGRGLVSYAADSCAGLIGFGEGRTLATEGLSLTPGPTSLDGFSVVMIDSVDGQHLGREGRYLITAVARCVNPGMVWNERGDSVGRNWGHGPSLCEGVPCRLEVRRRAESVRLFALSPDGTRRDEVPNQDGAADRARFELGPRHKTLWYEVVIED